MLMEKKSNRVSPSVIRSRLVLEVASELVGRRSFQTNQARISLREQGPGAWKLNFFGSDAPDAIEDVRRREVDVAIINPAAPLTLAYRGTGPFKEPIPVRAIAVIPSSDMFVLAVCESTGLVSLSDIRERRFPLRVSLRGQKNHSLHLIVNQILSEAGFSLDDIVAWGGQVRYDPGMPGRDRINSMERGEVDAIFDESLGSWGNRALDLGMRFLSFGEPILQRLEVMGFRRATITKAGHPKLSADIETLDFSGWPIFTHEEAPESLVTSFCEALEARKDSIPWQGDGALPLEHMCRDSEDGPLDVPLHPAAESFWRARGYLT